MESVISTKGITIGGSTHIVDVAVVLGAADAGRVGRVLQVEEDETTQAVGVTRTRANGGTVLGLLVDDNVVGGADGELVEPTSEVVTAKLDGLVALLEVDIEELGEVEDLDTVALELGADDEVVLVATQLLPQRASGGGDDGGEEADDLDAALGQDLDERGAVVLAVGDELTAGVGVDPAPAARSGTELGIGTGRAELGVVHEVIQVDVLALEGVQRVALDGLGLAVDTLGVVKTGPLGGVEQAGLGLAQPEVHLLGHDGLVELAVVVQLWSFLSAIGQRGREKGSAYQRRGHRPWGAPWPRRPRRR